VKWAPKLRDIAKEGKTKIPLSNTTPILLPNAMTSSLPLEILSAFDIIKSFLL